jgi:hypothetical protein
VRTKVLAKVLLVLFLFNAGCEQKSKPDDISGQTNNELEKLSIYSRYSPAEIAIIPLTDFVRIGDSQQARINLYVKLLDSFGSEIKSPCIFRFELYEKVQRSAEPKGARVMIWPDIDLTKPAINNRYWRNFLRAYEFNLPFGAASKQTYILEVTCLCPTGRRLISDFTLNTQKDFTS